MDRKLLFIKIFLYISIGISISGIILLFTNILNKTHNNTLHIIMGLFILLTGLFNVWLAIKLKNTHIYKISYTDGMFTPTAS